jgi:uncharacterized phage-associated protein
MIDIEKNIGKIDTSILAEYILEKWGNMSHLKIQKLLYLIEGYHLAYFSESLMEDEFEAWVHGPVSRKLYNQLRNKSALHTDLSYVRSEGESLPSKILEAKLTSEQLTHINEVLKMYAEDTAFELESITHQQTPWIEARKGYHRAEICNEIIPKESMRLYFLNFIN